MEDVVGSLLRRGLAAGAAVLGIEAAYAVLRPSPHQPDFDPSGVFGATTNPELRVAVLGDSSVTAPGVSGPEEIWVQRICRRLAADYRVILESFAVGGSTAGDLITGQMERAVAFQPDVVFVSVGANDAIKGVSRRRFEQNLDYLIGRLKDSGAAVIQSGVGDLGSIPRLYPPLSNLLSKRALSFDQTHWRVAERHGTDVVHQRSDDREPWYKDRNLWSADLFHVSAAGHERWANTAWKTVERVVNGHRGSR